MTRRRSVFHKPLVNASCFLAQCLAVVSVGASTGALDGQVHDDDTGEPVGWVLLVVEGLDRARSADAAGRFTFRDLPPGEHVLKALRIGYREARFPFQIRASATTRLSLTLGHTPLETAALILEGESGGFLSS